MTNTVGHQLAYDQPDVFKLLRWQVTLEPVQGVACRHDGLGIRGESQIDPCHR